MTKVIIEFVGYLAMFALIIVVLMVADRVNAQEIAYCKNMAGDIVMVAKGSPCPQGYYPL